MRFRRFSHGCERREEFAHARGPWGAGVFKRHSFGGRPRLFEQGDLRFVTLKLISEKPSHGYEIIKAIEARLGGAYAPSPGVIYPTLTLLEEMGAIRVVETDGPRKLYAITAEGDELLRENGAAVEAIFSRIAGIHDRHGGGPSPQVVRAMENLKTALRLRLSRGPLAPEEMARVVSILDAAARSIELDG